MDKREAIEWRTLFTEFRALWLPKLISRLGLKRTSSVGRLDPGFLVEILTERLSLRPPAHANSPA